MKSAGRVSVLLGQQAAGPFASAPVSGASAHNSAHSPVAAARGGGRRIATARGHAHAGTPHRAHSLLARRATDTRARGVGSHGGPSLLLAGGMRTYMMSAMQGDSGETTPPPAGGASGGGEGGDGPRRRPGRRGRVPLLEPSTGLDREDERGLAPRVLDHIRHLEVRVRALGEANQNQAGRISVLERRLGEADEDKRGLRRQLHDLRRTVRHYEGGGIAVAEGGAESVRRYSDLLRALSGIEFADDAAPFELPGIGDEIPERIVPLRDFLMAAYKTMDPLYRVVSQFGPRTYDVLGLRLEQIGIPERRALIQMVARDIRLQLASIAVAPEGLAGAISLFMGVDFQTLFPTTESDGATTFELVDLTLEGLVYLRQALARNSRFAIVPDKASFAMRLASLLSKGRKAEELDLGGVTPAQNGLTLVSLPTTLARMAGLENADAVHKLVADLPSSIEGRANRARALNLSYDAWGAVAADGATREVNGALHGLVRAMSLVSSFDEGNRQRLIATVRDGVGNPARSLTILGIFSERARSRMTVQKISDLLTQRESRLATYGDLIRGVDILALLTPLHMEQGAVNDDVLNAYRARIAFADLMSEEGRTVADADRSGSDFVVDGHEYYALREGENGPEVVLVDSVPTAAERAEAERIEREIAELAPRFEAEIGFGIGVLAAGEEGEELSYNSWMSGWNAEFEAHPVPNYLAPLIGMQKRLSREMAELEKPADRAGLLAAARHVMAMHGEARAIQGSRGVIERYASSRAKLHALGLLVGSALSKNVDAVERFEADIGRDFVDMESTQIDSFRDGLVQRAQGMESAIGSAERFIPAMRDGAARFYERGELPADEDLNSNILESSLAFFENYDAITGEKPRVLTTAYDRYLVAPMSDDDFVAGLGPHRMTVLHNALQLEAAVARYRELQRRSKGRGKVTAADLAEMRGAKTFAELLKIMERVEERIDG